MQKAIYMKGSTVLTDKQRLDYSGCRMENADVFQGVSSGVTSAIIIGEYPDIEMALKEKKITFDIVGLNKTKMAVDNSSVISIWIKENSKENKPTVLVASKGLGFDVTGKEITEAWAKVSAE